MRLTTTSGAPGYPTRGLFQPVPMHPDDAGGAGGGAEKKAEPKAPEGGEKKAEAKADDPPAKEEPKAPETSPKKEEPPAPKPPPKKAEAVDKGRKVDVLEHEVESKLEALNARLERQRQKALVSEMRRLGADPEIISDADIIGSPLLGNVDPDDPAGAKVLLDFKKSRPKWFVAEKPAPQESLNKLTSDLKAKGLSKDKIEARARLAAKLGGGQ